MSKAEIPTGAIENGREFFRRLEEFYSFEHDGHTLATCAEWQELRRCFEEVSSHVAEQPPAPSDLMKEVREALEATEVLDNRDDCPECHGEGEPEQCELCFPAADDARLKRRDVLSKLGEA